MLLDKITGASEDVCSAISYMAHSYNFTLLLGGEFGNLPLEQPLDGAFIYDARILPYNKRDFHIGEGWFPLGILGDALQSDEQVDVLSYLDSNPDLQRLIPRNDRFEVNEIAGLKAIAKNHPEYFIPESSYDDFYTFMKAVQRAGPAFKEMHSWMNDIHTSDDAKALGLETEEQVIFKRPDIIRNSVHKETNRLVDAILDGKKSPKSLQPIPDFNDDEKGVYLSKFSFVEDCFPLFLVDAQLNPTSSKLDFLHELSRYKEIWDEHYLHP